MRFSIKNRITSFAHAFRGLKLVLSSQHNAWIHASMTALVCIAAIALEISKIEWCLIVISITAVWSAEAMNTAIENLMDFVSPELHPLARRTKDAAAGAVLVVAIGAAIVGGIIFLPHILALAG